MRKILFVYCCLMLSGCGYDLFNPDGYKKQYANTTKESWDNNKRSTRHKFPTENPKLVMIGFAERFDDTVGIVINNKIRDVLPKHDDFDCKDCAPDFAFRKYTIDYNRDKVFVFLKKEKKYVEIKLDQRFNIYVIYRYNDVWYVRKWPRMSE